MVFNDLLLFIIPVTLVLHRRILEVFQERKHFMFASSLLMPLLHYMMVGFRWQVVLLYLLHLLLVAVSAVLIAKETEYKLGHGGVRRICSFFVVITLILTAAFPIGLLMVPTGPYQIGTANVTYTSSERREVYGKTYDMPRSFVIQFYYPADRIGTRRAPLIEHADKVEAGLSKTFGIPEVLVGYLSQLESYAWYGNEISENEKQYPVVVLSHGWKGFKNIHMNLAQELASNGYIVAAIDHSYGSLATVFDTGEVAELNPAALPKREESDEYLKYAAVLLDTYKWDIIETINLMSDMNQPGYNSMLSERMNLDKIALLGHSTGGGAAVRAAIADERVKAVIGLDAWVEPMASNEILAGLKVPYLHVMSEAWRGGMNEPNLNMLMASSSDDRWVISIDGTKHTDFTMIGNLSPISRFIGLSGSNGKEAESIQQDLIGTFFAYYMEGKNTKKAIADIVDNYESATADAVYMK